MANRAPARIAETLRGVAAGTTMFRISEGQARTISAGILNAAADVADMVAERDATIAALWAELSAAVGCMLNARIDLATGCTKATAIRTIDGGIARAERALPDPQAPAPEGKR